MATTETGDGTHAVEGEATTGINGMTLLNGLTLANGLALTNGLTLANGLSLMNGLTSTAGLAPNWGHMTSDKGRATMSYLVKCALGPGKKLSKQDNTGKWWSFDGGVGLGPGWETGACDQTCQEAVSACLMAHVNTAGVHIPLWMVSAHTAMGWGTSSSYPNREGTYFGNVFKPNATTGQIDAFYCIGPNFADSTVPGRLGAYQVNAPYKNPFGTNALCSNNCVGGGPAGEGYTSCKGYSNPVTVWRQPAPYFDPNRDYKICAKHSGKCLDADLNTNYDGGKVVQWSFGGANNQRWRITKLPDSYYKICNKGTGRCLDLYLGDPTDGGRICTWTYYGNDYQRWAITPVGGGNYSIVAKLGAKSIDVSNISHADGALIHQWRYINTDNQIWSITAL